MLAGRIGDIGRVDWPGVGSARRAGRADAVESVVLNRGMTSWPQRRRYRRGSGVERSSPRRAPRSSGREWRGRGRNRPGVDGGTAGQECDGLGRSAIVSRGGPAPGWSAPDDVAALAVDHASGAAGADQVKRAGDLAGLDSADIARATEGAGVAGQDGIGERRRVVRQRGRARVIQAAGLRTRRSYR